MGAFALFFLIAYPLCILLAETVPFLRPSLEEGPVQPRATWAPAVDLAFYALAIAVLAWIENAPLVLLLAATAAGLVLLLTVRPPAKVTQS